MMSLEDVALIVIFCAALGMIIVLEDERRRLVEIMHSMHKTMLRIADKEITAHRNYDGSVHFECLDMEREDSEALSSGIGTDGRPGGV